MAIVTLYHLDWSAHLDSERMDVHTIVQQSECRVGVSKAVERASLACSRAYQQLILFEKIPECLVKSISDCSIS